MKNLSLCFFFSIFFLLTVVSHYGNISRLHPKIALKPMLSYFFQVTYLVVLLQFQISIPSDDMTAIKRNISSYEAWKHCDSIFNL